MSRGAYLCGDWVELADEQGVTGGLGIRLWQVANHLQNHSLRGKCRDRTDMSKGGCE